MLKASALLCVYAVVWCSQTLAAAAVAWSRSDSSNFLDDKQWLTTISQYDKEVGQWNKFRDFDGDTSHRASLDPLHQMSNISRNLVVELLAGDDGDLLAHALVGVEVIAQSFSQGSIIWMRI